MIAEADSGGWLTATGSARAIACHASLTDSGPPRVAFAASGTSAGSVVHAALQLWLERGSWMASEPLAAVRSALRETEVSRGTRLTSLPLGGRALSSLRTIATQLSTLLVQEEARPEDVRIEAPLVAAADRLWGVPDLVVEAARTVIVDFKTGFGEAEGSDAALRQLMFYAYLLRSALGRTADQLVVLSPTRVERIPCDDEQVERYVARLRSLRETRARAASPEQALCAYCPLRLRCEAHWNAVDEWESPDAVRGRLLAIVTAMNGVRSLTIQSERAKVLVSVPGSVRMPSLCVGDQVRLVRIRPAPVPGHWRAGRSSEIARAG